MLMIINKKGTKKVQIGITNMNTLNVIQNTREYLDYIEEHILNVRKAWEALKVKCTDMRFVWDDYYFFSIDKEVDLHDLSKLSEEEFIQYRKYFYPIEGEPDFDISVAWKHHFDNNPHHWENWASKEWGDNPHWEIHCVHMVLDWMAMGYKFEDTAQEYYEKNKDKIRIPEWAESFIYEIFERIKK